MNNSDSPFIGGSFWSSTFVHATNDHDYMVVSHVMNNLPAAPFKSLYRASVLDITDPSSYHMFTTTTNVSDIYTAADTFNASFGDYGMGSTRSDDVLSQMRTFSTAKEVEFDLTFNLSSPVLLNGGLGMFACESSLGYE